MELHATAAANLLSGTALRAPAPAVSVLVLLLVGAAGAAGYWVRSIVRWTAGRLTARAHAAGVIVAAFAAYAGVAYLLFTQQHIVLPLVVPLAVQAPLALVLVLLTPPTVHVGAGQGRVRRYRRRRVHRTRTTPVAQEYASVMNRYVQALAQPVWVRGGAALSPQGDGFIGLWRAATSQVPTRTASCGRRPAMPRWPSPGPRPNSIQRSLAARRCPRGSA